MGTSQLREVVAGRWQVPLFVIAIGLLATSIWKLRPDESDLPFNTMLNRAVALRHGGLFDAALRLLDELEQAENRTPRERAQVARIRAETLYFQQRESPARSPTALRQIPEAYAAGAAGYRLEPIDHYRLGQVYEWLNRPPAAIREYRNALEAGVHHRHDVHQRLIELMLQLEPTDSEAVDAELDSLLAEAVDSPDHLLWAAEQRVGRWIRQGREAEAIELLESLRPRLVRTAARDEIDYLHAFSLVRMGRDHYDEADRELRALRDRIGLSDSLHARSGWLLGELNLRDERPQAALAFFRDVLRSHRSGEYRAASLLGQAIALAELERFDESLASFEQLLVALPQHMDSAVVNPVIVRTALATQAEGLKLDRSKQNTALRYIGLARLLTRPDDMALQAEYTAAMANIYAALARSKRALAETSRGSAQSADPKRQKELQRDSRRYFGAAGDEYQRLARLLTLSEEASAKAAWASIQMYKQAGLVERQRAALHDFIAAHPTHVHVPEARYELGRAYQDLGVYKSAIHEYEQNLREHPRSISALRSRVELGAAYMDMGEPFYDQAEETFLVLVEQPAGPGLITPAAEEFKDALFLLATLYERRREYGKAIARLEEFLKRYGNDPRAVRGGFLLAESYRKSAAVLYRDLAAPANLMHRNQLEAWRRQRLQRAAELYTWTLRTLADRPESTRTARQEAALQLSYFYRADCVFELAEYERALGLYEQATLQYENDTAALAGLLQIIRCHHHLGRPAEARRVVRRALVLTRKMPDEAFAGVPDGASDPSIPLWDRTQWEAYFNWLADSTLFTSNDAESMNLNS